jgi:hypothetical protein
MGMGMYGFQLGLILALLVMRTADRIGMYNDQAGDTQTFTLVGNGDKARNQ